MAKGQDSKKQKRERFVSPTGIAAWCFVHEPDTEFNAEGTYRTDLVVTDKKARMAFIAQIRAHHKEAVAAAKKEKPGKTVKEADLPYYETEDGETAFKFRMRAKATSKRTGKTYTFTPALFDARLTPIPAGTYIGSGSRIKVSYELNPYYVAGTGAGVSLRLVGMQVLDLVEGRGKDASSLGFSEEEDGSFVSGGAVFAPKAEKDEEDEEGEEDDTEEGDEDDGGDF